MSTDPIAETLAEALQLERSGKPEEALACFDAALKEQGDALLLHSNRGLLLERMQRYEDALQSFQAAAKIEPNFRDHYNAGNMLLFLERNSEAKEAFDDSIACREDYPEAWVNRGIACNGLDDAVGARVNFEKALEINESFYPALRCLAILDSSLENETEAIAYYERAAKAQPQLSSAWFELGCALYKSLGEGQVFFEPDGPEGRTIQAFDKVIELAPETQGAWGRKIGTLFRLADAAQATDRAAAGAQKDLPQMLPLIHAELASTIEAACQRFPDDPWFKDRQHDAEAMVSR